MAQYFTANQSDPFENSNYPYGTNIIKMHIILPKCPAPNKPTKHLLLAEILHLRRLCLLLPLPLDQDQFYADQQSLSLHCIQKLPN